VGDVYLSEALTHHAVHLYVDTGMGEGGELNQRVERGIGSQSCVKIPT
jgi:hypothetical protein